MSKACSTSNSRSSPKGEHRRRARSTRRSESWDRHNSALRSPHAFDTPMASILNPDASPDPCSARLVNKSTSPHAAATPYDSPVRYFSPLNSVATTYPTAFNPRTAMAFNSVASPFVNDSTSAPNPTASKAVLSATSNVNDASSPIGFTSYAHPSISTNSIVSNARSMPSPKGSDCGARRAPPIGPFNHSPTPPTPIYSSTSPVPFQRASGHGSVEEVSSSPFYPPKQASSPRAWWDQTKLASLLALSREQKLTEIRQRFLRRLRPIIPLASNGSLPWNDIPALCATKAIQITGIPDCCPLPGFTARGISGLPTRFLSLYLKHLPDDTNQGIVFRRMKETDSRGKHYSRVLLTSNRSLSVPRGRHESRESPSNCLQPTTSSI